MQFTIFCQLRYYRDGSYILIFKKLSGKNVNERFSERHFHFLGSHFAAIFHQHSGYLIQGGKAADYCNNRIVVLLLIYQIATKCDPKKMALALRKALVSIFSAQFFENQNTWNTPLVSYLTENPKMHR